MKSSCWKPTRNLPSRRAPRCARVILQHMADPAAQGLLALQRGDVDVARDLTADQIVSLAGSTTIAVDTQALRQHVLCRPQSVGPAAGKSEGA